MHVLQLFLTFLLRKFQVKISIISSWKHLPCHPGVSQPPWLPSWFVRILVSYFILRADLCLVSFMIFGGALLSVLSWVSVAILKHGPKLWWWWKGWPALHVLITAHYWEKSRRELKCYQRQKPWRKAVWQLVTLACSAWLLRQLKPTCLGMATLTRHRLANKTLPMAMGAVLQLRFLPPRWL